MNRGAMFFAPDYSANVFIGGVGATYLTSESDVVAETTLELVEIKNFKIDGSNNVSFYSSVIFNCDNGFLTNETATWFIDLDGLVTDLGASLTNVTNLKYVYLPNLVNLSGSTNVAGNNEFKHLHLPSVSNLVSRYFLNDAAIRILDFRNATSATQGNLLLYQFHNMLNLERLNISSLITTGNQLNLTSYTSSTFCSGYNMKSGLKIYYNTALGITDRNAFNSIQTVNSQVQIGDIYNINGLAYECVSGTPVLDGEFQYNATGNTVASRFSSAINSDTRSGTYENVIAGSTSNFVYMYCDTIGSEGNAIICTEDAGNTGSATFENVTFIGGNEVHQWLMYMRDYENATLIEVGTPITVNPPTTLSTSTQTATSVDLNFTLPTPNVNGNDGYEVWVYDGTVYRHLFEYGEISTTGDTLDLTEVFNDIGTISGITIKIRTIDGHMNYSDFSNETTIP